MLKKKLYRTLNFIFYIYKCSENFFLEQSILCGHITLKMKLAADFSENISTDNLVTLIRMLKCCKKIT